MILVFELDYRSSSQVYEKIFFNLLMEKGLKGSIQKDHFELKLYVESQSLEELEAFATTFGRMLPHSIFFYGIQASIVEEMPESIYEFSIDQKLPLPFCPQCLSDVMDTDSIHYYDIFTECEVCGYGIEGEHQSYQLPIRNAAQKITDGEILKVHTSYGVFFVGRLSEEHKDRTFDLIAYDLATIARYTNATEEEMVALGAIEKPFVRLRTTINFVRDFELERELIRFKIADDLLLHLLMEQLHVMGIDLLMITNEPMQSQEVLSLVEPKMVLEPIEVVVSKKEVAIVRGQKGLPVFDLSKESIVPHSGAFSSVLKEHRIEDEQIAGVFISQRYSSNIVLYGQKYGMVEYLMLDFNFGSMQEIFESIRTSNSNGKKLIENYQKTFPEHFASISQIIFKQDRFTIYGLWGIAALVLGLTKNNDLILAGNMLEEKALSFLGERGPRIDYKLVKHGSKVLLDPMMTIRTVMSFMIAGVDPLSLSYGVVESFVEMIVNELDDMKQELGITAVVASGSLFGNRDIFAKMSNGLSKNHTLYFNNALPIEGRNIFYGASVEGLTRNER